MALNEVFKDFASKIEKLIGQENVLKKPEELYPYKYDASRITGRLPKLAVYPKTAREISEIVKLANEFRIHLIPRGRGSSLTGSSVAHEVDAAIVSLVQMDKIIEVNMENSYVVTEPGVIIDELNVFLATYGYMFPPDPGSGSTATIGGGLASNSGGMRGAKYGTMKNWVLEAEVVLPTGELVSLGNKTLKWRQGLDLLSLIIGCEGTLGIITNATLKIWPLPEKVIRILVYFDDVKAIGNVIRKFGKRGIKPLIAEFLDRATMDAVSKATGLEFTSEAEFLLMFDLDGPPEAIQRYLKDSLEIIESERPVKINYSDDPVEMEKLYAARKGAVSSLLRIRSKPTQTVAMEDVVVPASGLPEMLEATYTLREKYGVPMPTFGHVGDGNIHPNLIFDLDDRDEVRRAEELYREIALTALKLGGYISGEHGIGVTRKELFVEALRQRNSLKALELMKEIKRSFDPNNILNPGKIF